MTVFIDSKTSKIEGVPRFALLQMIDGRRPFALFWKTFLYKPVFEHILFPERMFQTFKRSKMTVIFRCSLNNTTKHHSKHTILGIIKNYSEAILSAVSVASDFGLLLHIVILSLSIYV
jgi:hypothetical protein